MVSLVAGLVMILGLSVTSCYPSHLVTPVGMSLIEVLENMKDNIDRQMREYEYW